MGKEQIGTLGSETNNENQAVISPPQSNIQRQNSGMWPRRCKGKYTQGYYTQSWYSNKKATGRRFQPFKTPGNKPFLENIIF